MQKSAYYCDHCKRIIGDIAHISLQMNTGLSGIAVPPFSLFGPGDGPANWTVSKVPMGFMHFHISCIEKYFAKMAEKIAAKKPKKK